MSVAIDTASVVHDLRRRITSEEERAWQLQAEAAKADQSAADASEAADVDFDYAAAAERARSARAAAAKIIDEVLPPLRARLAAAKTRQLTEQVESGCTALTDRVVEGLAIAERYWSAIDALAEVAEELRVLDVRVSREFRSIDQKINRLGRRRGDFSVPAKDGYRASGIPQPVQAAVRRCLAEIRGHRPPSNQRKT